MLIGIVSAGPTEQDPRFRPTVDTAALVDSGRTSRVDPLSGAASARSKRLDRKDRLNQERIVRSMGLAEAASQVGTHGAATIAVIDAGISTRGPVGQPLMSGFDVVDVDTSAWRGRGVRLIPDEDYTGPDGDVTSRSDHGSVVAGAVRSACPACTIMPVRAVFPVEVTRGDTTVRVDRAEQDDVARAIRHATDRGADVINLSLGFQEPGEQLALAINYAYSRGVVLAAAAGNGGREGLLYPARYAHAIGVGASTLAGGRALQQRGPPSLRCGARPISHYEVGFDRRTLVYWYVDIDGLRERGGGSASYGQSDPGSRSDSGAHSLVRSAGSVRRRIPRIHHSDRRCPPGGSGGLRPRGGSCPGSRHRDLWESCRFYEATALRGR